MTRPDVEELLARTRTARGLPRWIDDDASLDWLVQFVLGARPATTPVGQRRKVTAAGIRTPTAASLEVQSSARPAT